MTAPVDRPDETLHRQARGAAAQRRGVDAERHACLALAADGWDIVGRRLRTPAGEVDIVARRGDMIAFVEVKARRNFVEAAHALSPRQSRRLLLAAEILLAAHPEWSGAAVRFDVVLVDAAGRTRRISDALRDQVGWS